ncbi:MAG: hypothetical protein IPJ49_30810 [Candidatus Obscuribacter sp.]|nr:hypothetical protein [Candidatus Obscuribacter sp.]
MVCSVAAACVALGAQAKSLSVNTTAFAPSNVVPQNTPVMVPMFRLL